MKAVVKEDREIKTLQIIAVLQSKVAAMEERIHSYYHEELILRGDKIMMREYREWFGIK